MATTTIIPEVKKEIKYSRESKDYDCYVTIDGERQYIGSAPTYSAAEKLCCDYAFDYYSDHHTPEKAAQVVLAALPTPLPPAPHADTLIAELPDGTPIAGVYNPDVPASYVSARTPLWQAAVGGDGYVILSLWTNDKVLDLELSPHLLILLRDLLKGDTLDRLMIVARVWEERCIDSVSKAMQTWQAA